MAAITHAVVISIDGCRPDVLLRSDTPNIRKLLDQSSYTFWARTIPESITLPSHTSMMTGVTAQRHGVTWNADLPAGEPQKYPNVPTIFELMKKAGYTTAMTAGKSKFSAVNCRARSTGFSSPDKTTIADDEVAGHAEQIIHEHRPDFLFVHLPSVDNVGHAKGWGTRSRNRPRCRRPIWRSVASWRRSKKKGLPARRLCSSPPTTAERAVIMVPTTCCFAPHPLDCQWSGNLSQS